MKICLDFLNCHLAVAELIVQLCDKWYCQRVAREMGYYTVCPSHYCMPQSHSGQKKIKLGPAVKEQGTEWQWLSKCRCYIVAISGCSPSPGKSAGFRVKTNYFDFLHQSLIPCLAHRKISINVCRMCLSVKEWVPLPYPVSSAISCPTCHKT